MVQADGFFGGANRVLPPSHLPVAVAEVVQCHGEVGEEGGVGCGLLVIQADGFFDGGNSVLPPPHLPVAVAEVA